MSVLNLRQNVVGVACLKGLWRLFVLLLALGPGVALAITFDATVSGGSPLATRMELIQETASVRPTGQYVALSFSSSTPLNNVYARAIVTGTGFRLNVAEPADHFIGDLDSTLRTSYWFIDVPAYSATATGNFQVEIWTGVPGAPGSTRQAISGSYTLSSRDVDQNAANNKIAFVNIPSALQLGQSFSVEVCYDLVVKPDKSVPTNIVIGPASLSSFNPRDALIGTKIDLYNSSNSFKCDPLYLVNSRSNQIYFTGISTEANSIRGTYTFRSRGFTALDLTPITAAYSGQYKFNSDFNLGRTLPAPTNSILISKSVNITASAGATRVVYTLTASNAGSQEALLDAFVDTLPSTPAAATYVSGSAKFNGMAIADPLISDQVLTWGNPGGSKAFLVPPNGSSSLTFEADLPGVYGDYTNQAIAKIGDVVIDTTLGMTDNVPATAMTRIGPQIAGRVFEDVNYGGGAGRACGAVSGSPSCSTTSGAMGRSGARVELYNSSTGAFVAATTTDANGDYGFSGLTTGTYVVRVVNSTVTSSRPGHVSGLLPVQTYRAEAPSGDSTAVTDRVGGEDPCSADAGPNTTNATLASLTSGSTLGGACNGAPATLPQSIAVVYVDPSVSTVSLRKPTGTFDFGFNFDTIVNVRDSGQGSLRQFILNSNALGNTGLQQAGQAAGREVSIFMIPDGTARPGLRAGLASQLATSGSNAGAAVITLASALQAISAADTSLDAGTQTVNVGDTNAGNVGSGGTVGVDGLALSAVPRPEVVIDANSLAGGPVLDVSGSGAILKGFALYNHRPAGETPAIRNTAAVTAAGATKFLQLLVGTPADGSDPGTSLRNAGVGIGVFGGAEVSNSLLAHHGVHNLAFHGASSPTPGSASGSATNNEFVGGAWNGSTGDSIAVAAPGITVSGNLIRDLAAPGTPALGNGKGIELAHAATGVQLTNNTIRAMRTAGIGVHGGSSGTTLERNVVTGTLGDGSAGSGPGILVSQGSGLGSGVPQRVKITRNSLYANNGLGIDHAAALPDGVTPNDGAVSDGQPNNGIDYPVLTKVLLDKGVLTLEGYVGSAAGQAAFANVTIELFVADNVPANQDGNVIAGDGKSVAHGEGRSFVPIGSCASGVTGSFACSSPVSGLAGGVLLAATATDSQGNTSEFGANVALTVLGVDVAGFVYADPNHNSLLDSGEGGTGQVLHVKLVPRSGSSCNGPSTASAPVDTSTGAYSFSGVTAADWCLVLDDNATASDVVPTVPAGWLRTETPTGIRQLSVASTALGGQNFGLYHGSVLSGTVFRDTGVGGGVANDGVRNGAEPGLANVTVKATDDSGAATYDTAYTAGSGTYELWIPASAGSGPVRIVETDLGGFVSTGGDAGTTGGTYTRGSDAVRFTHAPGSSYSGVNFGDVPANAFLTDGAQSASPGSTLWFTHTFIAGTAGSVSFAAAATANPALDGWAEVIYRDSNCNGLMDGAEGASAITGALAVVAGEQVCLLLKQFVPATAGHGAQNQVVLTASFVYSSASPELNASHTRSDVTTVGTQAGLTLLKSVDKASARPGDTLTYTIVYTNNSAGILTSVKIHDSTPAFTTFGAAQCLGALPASLTACTVSTSPPAGATGAIEWTLTGSLSPGGSGSVSFTVTVDP